MPLSQLAPEPPPRRTCPDIPPDLRSYLIILFSHYTIVEVEDASRIISRVSELSPFLSTPQTAPNRLFCVKRELRLSFEAAAPFYRTIDNYCKAVAEDVTYLLAAAPDDLEAVPTTQLGAAWGLLVGFLETF